MTRQHRIAPLIVANWKMQVRTSGVVARISALRKFLHLVERQAHVVLCPSFPSLPEAHRTIGKSLIRLGAQDVFWKEAGAFTGEVSPLHLRDCGVTHIIIGHSERRQLLGETDAMVAQKMLAATSLGFTPILCVGETADERRRGKANQVIANQLLHALRSLPPPPPGRMIAVAYEPIWAIGTGQPADPIIAMNMLDHIHQVLLEFFPAKVVARQCPILYGGSVDRQNVTDYVGPELYHGALVGSASLEIPSFVAIVKNILQSFHS